MLAAGVVAAGWRILKTWVPVLGTILAVFLVAELAHAHKSFSSHFAQPSTYGSLSSVSEYSAHVTQNGLDVFALNARSEIAFETYGSNGRLHRSIVVDHDGDYPSEPSMAWRGSERLGAWVSNPSGTVQPLRVALVTNKAVIYRRVTDSGVVEHPSVIAGPGGSFVVLFDWQPSASAAFNVYAVRISRYGIIESRVAKLTSGSYYDFYPRGAWTGNRLQLVYLDVCCSQRAFRIKTKQFTAAFLPISPAHILGTVGLSRSLPSQWGVDVEAGQGGIWAAWLGPGDIGLTFWEGGHMRFNKVLSQVPIDAANPALSLALLASGGEVYYTTPGPLGAYVTALGFTHSGVPIPFGRISYDGGDDANPRVGVLSGRPEVIWQNERGLGEPSLQASFYQPHVSPSLAEALGLGSGNAWLDALFLVIIGLAAGLPLTVVNALIVVPLLLIWLPISRIRSERVAWFAYVALVATVLALVFAVPSLLNRASFVISQLGLAVGWVAVFGGVLAGVWITRTLMRNEETVYRAAVFVIVAFYVIGAAWAVGQVEARISLV